MQVPLVGTRSRVLARFGAFVPLGTTKTVGFRVQHRVQRLFHRAAHHFAQMLLNLLLIDLDHLAQLRYFLACFSLVGGLHRRSSRTFLRPSVLPTRPTPPQMCEK